jgi:hypothetical protein
MYVLLLTDFYCLWTVFFGWLFSCDLSVTQIPYLIQSDDDDHNNDALNVSLQYPPHD